MKKRLPRKIKGLAQATREVGWRRIFESFSGAWQRNVEIVEADVLTHWAVFACITRISQDIGKLGLCVVKETANGLETKVKTGRVAKLLKRPNKFHNRIQFVMHWITCKLIHGNVYVLKERDQKGDVIHLYILDPSKVTVLVSPNKNVFYRLGSDNLQPVNIDRYRTNNQPDDTIAVPASEIIHDTYATFFHPLVGVTPIMANGLLATHGLKIANSQAKFFENNSKPGGILSGPNEISDETAERLKEHYSKNFTGDNAGKVLVLGDGLSFQHSAMTAKDSEMIDQLKYSAEMVCTTYHVPPFMVGIGPEPTYNNVESRTLQYYTQCLQSLIEAIELLLDEGLDVPANQRTRFEIKDLIRMDRGAQVDSAVKLTGAGLATLDESRAEFNKPPLPVGGDAAYLQQQNFSVPALAKRDAREDPFGTAAPPPPAEPVEPPDTNDAEKLLMAISRKAIKEISE